LIRFIRFFPFACSEEPGYLLFSSKQTNKQTNKTLPTGRARTNRKPHPSCHASQQQQQQQQRLNSQSLGTPKSIVSTTKNIFCINLFDNHKCKYFVIYIIVIVVVFDRMHCGVMFFEKRTVPVGSFFLSFDGSVIHTSSVESSDVLFSQNTRGTRDDRHANPT
jgi:hypothetical protein